MELAGTEIKISCIEPGLVMAELHHELEIYSTESMNITRPLQPEDVARCVRFTLEQSSHIRIPRLMLLPGDHVV